MVDDVRGHVPAIGEAKRGIDGYLSYLLRQASTLTRAAMDRELVQHDLTFAQYTALMMINAYPELSSADLARVSLLTPQSVNGVVKTLEGAGLIARHPHATHRKILCLSVTPQGTERLAAARKTVRAVSRLVEETLEGESEERIKAWLTRLALRLSEFET